MLNSKPVKVGIIGCGRVTQSWHLPALKGSPFAEVIAVSDINHNTLKQVADKYHIKNRYADFLMLLENPEVEAVAVSLPVSLHVKAAVAALKTGKHVLIEKPLALSMDECNELIALASQSSAVSMAGLYMRWHRLVKKARKVVQSGALGKIRLVRTVFTDAERYSDDAASWKNKRSQGGGTLFGMAVHHFDMLRFLLQEDFYEIFAVSQSEHSDDDASSVVTKMNSGIMSESLFSKGAGAKHEVEIYGEDGRLKISLYRFDGLQFTPNSRMPGDARTRIQGMIYTLKELPHTLFKRHRGGEWVSAFEAQWRHFAECIRQGIQSEFTLIDGKRALQAVLTALKSVSTGRVEKILNTSGDIASIASDTDNQR